jgi:hypothetical protein
LKSRKPNTIAVPKKGQVRIRARPRKKYSMREGMKRQVDETPFGLLSKPTPDMEDLAGVDAGKYTYEEMTLKLDRLRARSR